MDYNFGHGYVEFEVSLGRPGEIVQYTLLCRGVESEGEGRVGGRTWCHQCVQGH